MSSQTPVPFGCYTILVDFTRGLSEGGAVEINYVISLIVESRSGFRIVSPRMPSRGYDAKLNSVCIDDMVVHRFIQLGDAGRTFSIQQSISPSSPESDVVTFFDKSFMYDGPKPIALYQHLLPLLAWLRTTHR